MSLRNHIGTMRSAWDVALAGVSFWETARASVPSVIHAPTLDRGRAQTWSRAVEAAQRHLRANTDGRLGDHQIEWLVNATRDGERHDELHGCLFGLDHANADVFVDSWRATAGDEVLLTAGDRLPVPDMLWPTLDRTALVSRPSSVVQPEDGDLPHVRRFRPLLLADRPLEVVVDFEWEAELQEVLLPAFTAAAGHPYADLGDFRGISGNANFPIHPRRSTPAVDCARDALASGASVIVLPELHVDGTALKRIAALVATHDEPCLMIAGTRHAETCSTSTRKVDDRLGTVCYDTGMAEVLISLRRPLIDALRDERGDDAARVLVTLEDHANAALATGELSAIVSVRGQLSRVRRAAATADPQWDGVQRLLVLDRALGSVVTGMQLALRREIPVPIPEHVSEAASRRSPRPTVRQRVLNGLDDKPRRPIDLGQRTGVPKRQLQRALGELVAAGKAQTVMAAAEDARAAFYQRVI